MHKEGKSATAEACSRALYRRLTACRLKDKVVHNPSVVSPPPATLTPAQQVQQFNLRQGFAPLCQQVSVALPCRIQSAPVILVICLPMPADKTALPVVPTPVHSDHDVSRLCAAVPPIYKWYYACA